MSRPFVLLGLILLLATCLRLFDLGNNPKSMYGDSVTLVYDAYSLLKTGHDQKGYPWPIVFSLGGARPPGYVYATIPFTAIFGPTSVAARAVSVLSGIGIVLLMFWLARLLFNQQVGLLAAFLTAISPWDLSLSRGAFESHFALFLTLIGAYLILKNRQKWSYLLIAALSLGLAMQTYPTYRLTVPVLFLLLWVYHQPFKSWLGQVLTLKFLLPGVIIVASLILSIVLTFGRGEHDRFTTLNIFTQPDTKTLISSRVQQNRNLANLPWQLVPIFHNVYLESGRLLMENYLGNFSLDFLFLQGDRNPRHNPGGFGQLYWIELLLIIIGAAVVFSKPKIDHPQRLTTLLLGWLLLAPLPTALVGDPHALRNSLMLPPLILLSAQGAVYILRHWTFVPKLALISLLLIQVILFADRFYLLAPNLYTNFWSYPAKMASTIALNNKANFNYIVISTRLDDAEFAYPAYAKLDPNLVIGQNRQPTKLIDYTFLKYDNVYLGSIPVDKLRSFIYSLPGSVLYIGSPKEQSFLDNYALVKDKSEQSIVVVAPKSPPASGPDLSF